MTIKISFIPSAIVLFALLISLSGQVSAKTVPIMGDQALEQAIEHLKHDPMVKNNFEKIKLEPARRFSTRHIRQTEHVYILGGAEALPL